MDKGETMMTMHKPLHPGYDINRLYVSRKVVASIEDFVDALIQRIEDYIEKSKERLITAAIKLNNNKRTNWKKKPN